MVMLVVKLVTLVLMLLLVEVEVPEVLEKELVNLTLPVPVAPEETSLIIHILFIVL